MCLLWRVKEVYLVNKALKDHLDQWWDVSDPVPPSQCSVVGFKAENI